MSMRQVTVVVPQHKSDDVVRCLKEDCGIENIYRVKGDASHEITVYATIPASGPILHYLDRIGVGVSYGRIAMLPVNLIKPLPRHHLKALGSDDAHAAATLPQRRVVTGEHARMAVEEIWQGVASGCELTWDFIGLIVVASLIAGLGLATNNTVMIVASMLLSPLMSPILGFTLGTVMRDWAMVRIGLRAEFGGLFATLLVGLVLGALFAPFSPSFDWPTAEMESRGETLSLIIGLAFAVPSGVGVALSVTGSGGANSLVGVAIAASLLPPVVNTGMCISFALVGPRWINKDLTAKTFLDLGLVSFCLFLLNVVVIYLVAILVFKLKGVQAVRRQSSMYNDTTTAMTDAERDEALVAAASSRQADLEAGKGGYHGAGAGAGAATPRSDADRRRSLQKAVKRVGEAALQSRRTTGSATSSPTVVAPATAAAGGAVPTKDNPMLSKALLD